MNDIIKEAYKKNNYPSATKLYEILNRKYKLEVITKVLKDESVFQLYYRKKPAKFKKIIASTPNETWQIDLCFMDKFAHSNNGYKYILICVDIFSRFAHAIPVKDKTVTHVLEAFQTIKTPPHVIESDNGSEFIAKSFQDHLEENDITHITALVGDHHFLGIIDRFTQTIKNMMYKRFIANDDTKWKTHLDDVVDIYNTSPHRGIFGYTPHEAMNNEEIIDILKSYYRAVSIEQGNGKRSDVQIDDTVRTKIPPTKFTRAFHPRWSGDIQKVEAVKGNQVTINGKKYKIVDVQKVVGKEEGEGLKADLKKDKIKRTLNKEGVDISNIVTTRRR